MRKCEACRGEGPVLYNQSTQRYCCKKCHDTPGDPFFERPTPAPPPPTPNEEAFAILETLTTEQRAALGHLLNNALAPVVLEASMLSEDVDAYPFRDAVWRLRDMVKKLCQGEK